MTSKPKRVARQHIPTWVERCNIHEGIVSNSMIQARMQEEIDDLRFALEVARQKLECISQCVTDDYLAGVV
jgi:hypothetical protein